MKVRKLHVSLTIVMLAAGILFSYSVQMTKEAQADLRVTNEQWEKEETLRQKIIEEKETNQKLEKQLREIKNRVTEIEKQLSLQQSEAKAIQKELEEMRMLAGLSAVQGPGVIVTLNDSKVAPDSGDVSNYIVHEQDVRRVVNELFAAGAEAISINEQRLVANSAIRCVGPTIIVNNVKSSIPFVIKAIGDPDTLESALTMPGGIVEILKSWTIDVKLEKKQSIQIPAFVGDPHEN
ncbi:DUF881 domain-containing protein [Bacillaceae bacterium]